MSSAKLPLSIPTCFGRIPGPGELIDGTYEVVGELGRGAMGIVLLAHDLQLGRKVAVKLIQSELSAAHFRERFLREARAMAEVQHPNLLGIYAFGKHGAIPYFVTEFVDGTTLDNVIYKYGASIDIEFALHILNGICAGVQAMHDAMTVHRDLKPANILVDSQLQIRVADFGVAQKYASEQALREFVGTPGYIAPELKPNGNPAALASPRSDVYSLGCIAYELLTGKAPFEADTEMDLMILHSIAEVPSPSTVRPGLPGNIDDVLFKALAKDPTQRTPSAAQLRWELRASRRKSLVPTRILVAEDDTDFRDILEQKLRAEFPYADVECVDNGQAALAAFDRNPASVVILDLLMPVLDGVRATALLRSRPAADRVPILVLTASGGPNEWKLLSSLGADRFLVKPVDLDDVVALVRRTVRQREVRAP